MNHVFKTVFNKSIGAWVAVPEFAKSHVSGGRSARVRSAAIEDRTPKLARVGLLTALIALSCGSAYALPTGGVFAGGSGSFDTSTPNTLNITATNIGTGIDSVAGGTGNRAVVINWGSPGSGGFNIATGETVNFIRNNQSVSAWINIDQSGTASVLNGALNAVNLAGGANGDRPVLLINPNGMSIGGAAVLDPNFVGIAGSYDTTTGVATLNNAPITVDPAYVIQNSNTARIQMPGYTQTTNVDVIANTPDASGTSDNSLPFSAGGAQVNLSANASPILTANLDIANGSNTNLTITNPLNSTMPAQVNLNFPGLTGLDASGNPIQGAVNTGAINLYDSNPFDAIKLVGGSSTSTPVSIRGGINNQYTYGYPGIAGPLSITGDFAIINDSSGNSGSNIQAGSINLVGANITDSEVNGLSLQSAGDILVDSSSSIIGNSGSLNNYIDSVSLDGNNVTIDGQISSVGAGAISVSADTVSVSGQINATNRAVSGGVSISGGSIGITGSIHDDGVSIDDSDTISNGVTINNDGGWSNPSIDISGSVSSGSSVLIDSYGNATIDQGASISGGGGVSISTDTNNGYDTGGLLSIDGSITTNPSADLYANLVATNNNPSSPGITLVGDNSSGGKSVNIGPNAVITNNGIGGVLIQDSSGTGDVSVSGTINNNGNDIYPVGSVLITGNNVNMHNASITTNGDTIDIQANTAISDVGSTLTSLNIAPPTGSITETSCDDGCYTYAVPTLAGINLMAGSDTFDASTAASYGGLVSGANLSGTGSNTISLDNTTIHAFGTQEGGLTTGQVGLYADDGIKAGQPYTGRYVNITGENNTISTAGSFDLEGTLTSTGAFRSGNGNTIIGATGVSIDDIAILSQQSQALVTGGDFAHIQGGQIYVGANGTVQSDGSGNDNGAAVTLEAYGDPANVGSYAGYGGDTSFADGQTSSYGDGSIDILGNLLSNSADVGGIYAYADTSLTQAAGSTIENTSIDPSGNGSGVDLEATDIDINGFIHNTDQNSNIYIYGANSLNIGSTAHIQGVDGIISVEASNGLAWQTGNKETSTGGVQINPDTTATGTPNSDNTVTTGTPSVSSIQLVDYGNSSMNVAGWLDAGQNASAPAITDLFIEPVNGISVYGQIPMFSYNLVDSNGNTVTISGASLTGSATYTGAPTAQSNVGTYSYSYNGGLSLTGSNASQYALAGFATPSSWQITPATLTVSGLSAANKVYDGNTNAAISGGVLSGLVNGDVVSALSTGTFATKNVGTGIDVTVNSQIGGVASGNYVLSNPASIIQADITPKPITEVAVANDKVYDGNTTAVVRSISSNGVVAGDTVSFGYSNANFDTPDVGNGKVVTVDGITASGQDAGNYLVTPIEQTTASITPQPIVIPQPIEPTPVIHLDPAPAPAPAPDLAPINKAKSNPTPTITVTPVDIVVSTNTGTEVAVSHADSLNAATMVGNTLILNVGGAQKPLQTSETTSSTSGSASSSGESSDDSGDTSENKKRN